MCSAKHDPTALDGFPLYWTERPKLLRAKTLEELSPADREVSKALAWLGIVFDTLKLVASEYNAHALTTYFGKETLPPSSFVVSTLLPNVCSHNLFHLFYICLLYTSPSPRD